MSKLDIIRAWKDAAYRNSLSEFERAQLPANPSGLSEIDEETLSSITGGNERRATPDGLVIQPRSGSKHTYTVDADVCCTSLNFPECGGDYGIKRD